MKIIAVISMKGGCAKSTLARHGSVILSRCGLLDLDPQQTSKKWIERRKAAGLVGPAMVSASPDQVVRVVDNARAKLDHLIIDTPPSHDDTRAIRAAVAVADFVVVPVKASPDDLEALEQTLPLLAGRRWAFVVTMATRSNMLERVRTTLAQVGDLAPVIVANRVAYPEAAETGAAVTEHDPRGSAAEEMRQLWNWIDVQTSKHVNT